MVRKRPAVVVRPLHPSINVELALEDLADAGFVKKEKPMSEEVVEKKCKCGRSWNHKGRRWFRRGETGPAKKPVDRRPKSVPKVSKPWRGPVLDALKKERQEAMAEVEKLNAAIKVIEDLE